jgi:hypothetical protein
VNKEVMFCAARVLAASPLTYFMCRDGSDLVALPIRKTQGPLPGIYVGSGCRGAASPRA